MITLLALKDPINLDIEGILRLLKIYLLNGFFHRSLELLRIREYRKVASKISKKVKDSKGLK